MKDKKAAISPRSGVSRKKVSRRQVLKGSAAALGAGAAVRTLGFPPVIRSAQAKKFLRPIVAGLNAKEGDPSDLSIREIPRILREKYDVELEIQVHPSSTLGTDLSQLEAVQTGFIDITSNSSAQFAPFTDAFLFMDLPYMFTSWEMANRFMRSDIFKAQAAKAEENLPLKILPLVGAGGFRMLSNSKRRLATPADVDGMKFRSQQSPIEISMIKKWGGNPTPVPWVETYTAIQQGVVDGFHVQPIWTHNFSFHEVLNHATEVKAMLVFQLQVMNKNTFDAMPEDIQKAFMLAAQDAADIGNGEDERLESFYQDQLRSKGLDIYTPSATEMKQWQDTAREVWTETDIDSGLLNQMRSLQS
jgi:TRAP-type C4-dicarboxylate transport system substrate-binding protein